MNGMQKNAIELAAAIPPRSFVALFDRFF